MEFEGRARIQHQLDIAPLIDVVFLLLIFFMLTSTFLRPEAIEIALPQADGNTRVEEAPIEVVLRRDGVVLVNQTQIALEALQARVADLLAGDGDRVVGVKADAEASVQQMMDVVGRIRSGGGRNLAFATRTSTDRPKP